METGENYTEVSIFPKDMVFLDMDIEDLMDTYSNPINVVSQMSKMSRTLCNIIYENNKMIEVLANIRSDFDIVITEPMFSECVSYPAVKLYLPLIYVLPLPTRV